MPFVYVNRAETLNHDTKLSLGAAVTSIHDTRVAVAVAALILHDTQLSTGTTSTTLHDTRLAINPRLAMIHSAGLVLFARGPRRPSRALGMLQPVARSAGAVAFGFDSHDQEDRIRLEFTGMSAGNYQALSRFFFAAAKGMSDTFTWADVAGVRHTVRFAEPLLQAEQVSGDRYNLSLELRVVA